MGPESSILNRRSRSRKTSTGNALADPPLHAHSPPAPSGPTTFFLRRERDMQRDEQQQDAEEDKPVTLSHSENNSYGVQSLTDALEGAFPTTTDSHEDAAAAAPSSPIMETVPLAGKKRKAGNPIHPKIAAAAQRIISSEQPSSRASSASSTFRVPSANSPFRDHLRKASVASFASQNPVTSPSSRLSPLPDSAIPGTPRSSSPRSLRLSDEECSVLDDTGSQAVHSSSGEDEEEDTLVEADDAGAGAKDAPNVPQLIMPSIAMPTRRPFTERGKRIGRLKVLVAGPAGVGKTSLIKSIMRSCEDIVHVDPPSSTDPSPRHSLSRKRNPCASTNYQRTMRITDIYASTKAYPAWWSEVDDSRTLRRRKSMGDVVLERNLCFIDTPGWDAQGAVTSDHADEALDDVVDYLEDLFRRQAALGTLTDSELLGLFVGGGGIQVDAVLYMFDPATPTITPAEADALRRLGAVTNIIPVIGHADTCTDQVLQKVKIDMAAALDAAMIKTFAFDSQDIRSSGSIPSQSPQTRPNLPYAISSALGDDAETMDASVLMSSEYLPPLIESDLSALVTQLFSPENISWLRHCAVKKFLHWRRETQSHSLDLGLQDARDQPSSSYIQDVSSPAISGLEHDSATASLISSPSHVLVPYPASSFYRSTSPTTSERSSAHDPAAAAAGLAMTRYANNASSEQDFTSVRLEKWAEDLQRSLETERRHQLQRTGMAAWSHESDVLLDAPALLGPLSLGSDDDALASATGALIHHQAPHTHRPKNHLGFTTLPAINPHDPLGILALGTRFRRQSCNVLRVLGGAGIVGAVAVIVLRNWKAVARYLGLAGPADYDGFGGDWSEGWGFGGAGTGAGRLLPEGYGFVGPAETGALGSGGLGALWSGAGDWRGWFWGSA